MRAPFLFLLLMLATVAVADAPTPPGETVTFTREQIDGFEQKLEEMVREREAAAFERGQMDQRVRCPALI